MTTNGILPRLAAAACVAAALAITACSGGGDPAAAEAPPAPAIVKTYACRSCGSVSSKPNKLKPCPRHKDGAPCWWKEIPRKVTPAS